MEWLDQMNQAIGYIEENLAGKIDLGEVAKLACCSEYHFQRMFSFIAGMSLSEYIRHRRLTLSAFELQNSQIRIIDLAMKYGYESPVSFTRAFQNLHGVTPSAARNKGVKLKAFPQISFHISIQGDTGMDYRIEEKDTFSVFGADTVVSTSDIQAQIREFLDKCIEDKMIDGIVKTAGVTEQSLMHAIYGQREDSFRYMICAVKPNTMSENNFHVVEVPASTWAVFTIGECPESETMVKLQSLWQKIFSEWFPTSGYEHAVAPEFEMFHKTEDQCSGEVWIPVVKK